VVIWAPARRGAKFLYSDDMADACVMMMNLPDEAFDQVLRGPNDFPLVNVGSRRDQSIADLPAQWRCRGISRRAGIRHEQARRNARKLLDIGRLRKLGWSPGIDLKTGSLRHTGTFSSEAVFHPIGAPCPERKP